MMATSGSARAARRRGDHGRPGSAPWSGPYRSPELEPARPRRGGRRARDLVVTNGYPWTRCRRRGAAQAPARRISSGLPDDRDSDGARLQRSCPLSRLVRARSVYIVHGIYPFRLGPKTGRARWSQLPFDAVDQDVGGFRSELTSFRAAASRRLGCRRRRRLPTAQPMVIDALSEARAARAGRLERYQTGDVSWCVRTAATLQGPAMILTPRRA